MNLRTFTAKDMPTALALVRKEMGSGAVILHTRSYKRGGLLGFFARQVVEVTVADAALIAKHRSMKARRSGAASATVTPSSRRPPEASASRREAPELSPTTTAGELIKKTYAAAYAEIERKQQRQAAQPAPSAASTSPVAVPGPIKPVMAVPSSPAPAGSVTGMPTSPTGTPVIVAPGPANEQLSREMREVRRMVAAVMRRQRQHEAGTDRNTADLPPVLFEQYLSLLKQEVTEELAEDIVQQVRRKLAPGQMTDPASVHGAVLQTVARLIPVDDEAGVLKPTADGRPRTIALIGPTGVGKTTTIAKLAAAYKLRQKKNIALVTLDTYRIAAVDQLKTYAQIIGVPLHVVSSVAEMIDVKNRCRGCDAILIDTAGRSQRDDDRLEQLSQLIQAADPHEVHLVLSSTCAQTVLLEAVERFSRIRTDRIIFTKLDEAVSFGVLLNVARTVNKRLSFVTTGQEVPHHIEPSRPERLAALVLGEGERP